MPDAVNGKSNSRELQDWRGELKYLKGEPAFRKK
jgi:hypothetical protein